MANQNEIESAQRLSQAGKTDKFIPNEGNRRPAEFLYNRGLGTSGYSLLGTVCPTGVSLNFGGLTEAQAQQLMAVTRDW